MKNQKEWFGKNHDFLEKGQFHGTEAKVLDFLIRGVSMVKKLEIR